ncbi:MAG: ABC transporter substrate-binding protein [Thermoleophilaceae bacterium]|nr:ABC transporter substrate-binding protein [Thermoleophilaceae bacterium]
MKLNAKLTLLMAFVACALLALSGCGDSGSDTKTAKETPTAITATADPAVAAMVPAAIKDKGELVVASDATYPPNEFVDTDGKTIIGMDPDLAKALGQVMGVKVVVKNATFDSILPGLAANKYDLGMSSFTDTKEREKTVDMVTYLIAGTSFYTAATDGTEITGLDGLCGLTVAVEKGTTQADDAEAQSAKCKTAGKKPVTVQVFTDQNAANLALTSGRAQVGMADSPVTAYIIEQSDGKLVATGQAYGEAPYGIAVNKESRLTGAVLAGLKSLIAGGQYKAILAKWNLADAAISEPKINDGIE